VNPDLAAQVLDDLTAAGLTLATAESLTGGGLGAVLTSVAGSSSAYVGGVVAYATRVKVDLLGVPRSVVDADGVVSDACAAAMAEGARRVLGADVAASTTGVAGPAPQEDKPVGRVHIAVAGPDGTVGRALWLEGDREAIRAATADAAMGLIAEVISEVGPREVGENL
jgi:PncC family amidohydrolase